MHATSVVEAFNASRNARGVLSDHARRLCSLGIGGNCPFIEDREKVEDAAPGTEVDHALFSRTRTYVLGMDRLYVSHLAPGNYAQVEKKQEGVKVGTLTPWKDQIREQDNSVSAIQPTFSFSLPREGSVYEKNV